MDGGDATRCASPRNCSGTNHTLTHSDSSAVDRTHLRLLPPSLPPSPNSVSDPMPSPQSEIVEHGDDPLPAGEQCDVANEERGRSDGRQIKKTAKQLLLLPFQRKNGKDKNRKNKKKQREGVPSPFTRSHSLDASANLCGLAIGSKHRTCSDRKPSSHHLFVKSLIEKNPFYAKDCNVHPR